MVAGPALAQSQTVTAEGVAGIQGGDQGIARDNALRDAQRKAVEQAVGALVASETLVENFVTVRDNILSKSQGYIQKYAIVKEGAQGNLYSVTITATVATDNLKNDLGALGLLMARVGKPRVLFMVAEQNIGQEIAVFWWSWWGRGAEFKGQMVDMAVSETALKEVFLGKGFNVVDISASTGRFEVSNAYRIADLTNDGAREFGRKLNAEVVITGKALAKEGPRMAGSQVGSYLADVVVTAIRVDNGQVLASARGEGVARHVVQHTGGNQAIEKAARVVADKLIDQITAKWQAEASGSQLIQVTIHGIASMRDLVTIKDFLQTNVRGVQSVIQRSFEGGVAVLELDAKATAQQIGDEIARKELKGLELEVVSATGNTLVICVRGICPGSRSGGPPPGQVAAAPPVAADPSPQASAGRWTMENDKLIITVDELNVGRDRVTLFLTYRNKTAEAIEVVLLYGRSALDDSEGAHYRQLKLVNDVQVRFGNTVESGGQFVNLPPRGAASGSIAFYPNRAGVKRGTTFAFTSEQACLTDGEGVRGAKSRQGEKFQVAIRNIEMR
jgi:hypothetical protein